MLCFFKQYYPIRNIFFIIGEGVFIYVAVTISSMILLGVDSFMAQPWVFIKILLITSVCQSSLYYNDLYNLRIADSYMELGLRLMQALGFASIFIAFVYLLWPQAIIGKGIFLIGICFCIMLIVSWRFCYNMILKHKFFDEKIFLIGSGELANKIRREISIRKDSGYDILGELEESNGKVRVNSSEYCGPYYAGLCDVAKAMEIKKIISCFKEKRHQFPISELLKCKVQGIDVVEGNSFYEMLTGKLNVAELHPTWLIFSDGFRKSRTRRFMKRLSDLFLVIILLIAFAPVMLVVALLVKLDSRGPVFFSQERIGENKRVYLMHKFRSMVSDAEKECGPVWAEANDCRITRVGSVIRKLRFDELPQLWNVLKGEMSFVGPRPEREHFVNELENVVPYYSERFSVKPGITGWAQVRYWYGASVQDAIEKLNYDLFYIKNMSTLMDLMIVLRTIKIVLSPENAR